MLHTYKYILPPQSHAKLKLLTKIFIFSILFGLYSLAFSFSSAQAATTYKCVYDSNSGNCYPCTNFTSMGACQASQNPNVCNTGLNPCVGQTCADTGAKLDSQTILNCPAQNACASPNSCQPDGICAPTSIVAGICPGNSECCSPGTPLPVQLPCGDLGAGWDCRPLSTVITGGYDCAAGGNTSPNNNPYHQYCGGNVGSGYKCCKQSSGAPPPFTGSSSILAIGCDPGTGRPDDGVMTALGCLDITGKKTIEVLLNWGVVVGGGIAFILILIAALQINTARGDAKRVQAGKELLFSALTGVLLIVISVVLLNFLGVNLLGLDSFGFGS